MSKKKEVTSLDRRDFFRKAGLGAGAASAAAVGLAAGSVSAAEPVRKSANSVGYRETDHVKKFYDLARF